MKKFFSTIVAAVAITTTGLAQSHKLVKLWETDSTLKVPESVLYDITHNVLYVSNIDGKQPWDKDGAGSIAKVSPDGKIIAVEWISGLNAPKGMGKYKERLYVADIDAVAVIDIKQSRIIERIDIEGAQGLNDISINSKGVIYVSDSRTKKIHQIENGKVSLYLENLKGPNGILIQDDDVYILDQGAMYFAGKDKKLTLITDGMEGGTDGIIHVKGKEFIVSAWSGSIWYINGKGEKELMLDTREQKINTADIGFDSRKKIVYVPTFWKNSVIAYSLQ